MIGLAAILHAAANQGKTYADWVAHIAVRTSRVVDWLDDLGGSGSTGVETTTRSTASGAPSSSMYGSPYLSSVLGYAASPGTWAPVCRIAQHAMPSLAALNAQVSAGGQVIIRATQIGYGNSQGRSRNSYTSVDALEGWPIRQRVDEFSYWNFATGAPETMAPAAGTGPVPYSHVSW